MWNIYRGFSACSNRKSGIQCKGSQEAKITGFLRLYNPPVFLEQPKIALFHSANTVLKAPIIIGLLLLWPCAVRSAEASTQQEPQ
jgi:hypothetical protein